MQVEMVFEFYNTYLGLFHFGKVFFFKVIQGCVHDNKEQYEFQQATPSNVRADVDLYPDTHTFYTAFNTLAHHNEKLSLCDSISPYNVNGNTHVTLTNTHTVSHGNISSSEMLTGHEYCEDYISPSKDFLTQAHTGHDKITHLTYFLYPILMSSYLFL